MDLCRVNSYLDKHFDVELKLVSPLQSAPYGLSEYLGAFYFRPLGGHQIYELDGARESIEQNRSALQDILGLLLDAWVKEQERADLLGALEIHMLHQLFNGNKVVPFRRRDSLWNHRRTLPREDRPSPHNLKVKKLWQCLLSEPSDALFIAQEIHRLLGHQIFIRINTPEEWLSYLNTASTPLTSTTMLVELENFPAKSFLIQESGRLLAQGSFLIIQSTSAKRLMELPHSGSDFHVVQGDLKRQFTYKYLKDSARLCLGLQPLYRYGGKHSLEGNTWLS